MTDLDSLDCFGKGKTPSYSRRNMLYPLLQVDLLVPTLIEGITIYNWWELYNQTYMPVLSSEARGMGVYKFSVEFIQQNAIDSDSEIKVSRHTERQKKVNPLPPTSL